MSFNPGGGGSGGSIASSSDAVISNPADGSMLTYNSTQQKWKNDTGIATVKAVAKYNTTNSTYPTRPSGFGSVEWIGPVDPGVIAVDGDTWISTL